MPEPPTINILAVGDVVGKPGRGMLADHLGDLIKEHDLELVICNAENIAGGSGITQQLFSKLQHYGVDVVTLGDHVYKKVEIAATMKDSDRIVRPANISAKAQGKRWTVVPTKSGRYQVAVTCVLGQLFMGSADSPWQAADEFIEAMEARTPIRVVDAHAEASSEKIGLGWYLNGRASMVFGTHTHTPTADARVLDGGTAFISDCGMTGPYDSILGRVKERVLHYFTTNMPAPFDVASGDPRLCGLLATVNPQTGRAVTCQRIEVAGRKEAPAPAEDDDKTPAAKPAKPAKST